MKFEHYWNGNCQLIIRKMLDRLMVIKQFVKKIFERLLSLMVIFRYTLHLITYVQNRDSPSHHPPQPPHPLHSLTASAQKIPSSSFCHLVRHPLFSCFQDSILISLPDLVSPLSILFKLYLCLGGYLVYSTSDKGL